METQDSRLGGISPETTQQVLAMLMAQLASQKKQTDPVADYLASLERENEEREKQNARLARTQSMNYPQSSSAKGGGSGVDNVMKVYGAADSASKLYNNQDLISNIGSAISK
jgi:hypothetical protein